MPFRFIPLCLIAEVIPQITVMFFGWPVALYRARDLPEALRAAVCENPPTINSPLSCTYLASSSVTNLTICSYNHISCNSQGARQRNMSGTNRLVYQYIELFVCCLSVIILVHDDRNGISACRLQECASGCRVRRRAEDRVDFVRRWASPLK